MQTQMLKNYFIICLCFFSCGMKGVFASGLEVSVAGDMVYQQSLSEESDAGDKVLLRGAELLFFAPTDHNFDGVISAAAHDEGGNVMFEVHEMYLASSKIIPYSNFRVGQFFLGIGRLNRFHQHDWNFTYAPRVHRDLLDNEGVFDSGLEYTLYLPTDLPLELTVGITSGFRFGHAHTAGAGPLAPTHYARMAGFYPFSSTNGVQLGFSYLGRKENNKNRMQLIGSDLTAKWRDGKFIRLLLQSEAWFRTQKNAFGEVSQQAGLYLFGEYGLSQANSIGLRVDGFKDLTKENSITNKSINQIHYGFTGQWTFHSSEFTKVRATVTHEMEMEEGVQTIDDSRFDLQFIFIMGSHPAHEF